MNSVMAIWLKISGVPKASMPRSSLEEKLKLRSRRTTKKKITASKAEPIKRPRKTFSTLASTKITR